MASQWMDHDYAVVLGPAAQRVLKSVTQPVAEGICNSLLTELRKGPNSKLEIRFDSSIGGDTLPGSSGETVYTATPLNFGAFTALHRPLRAAEIERMRGQHGGLEDSGYYVVDLLPPETAFRRWPRPV